MKIELSSLLVALLSSHFTNGLEVLCPPDWTQFRGGCYRFVNQPRHSWEDAEAFCNTYQLSKNECSNKTGHLVTIESDEENQFLFDWWITVREPLPADTIQVFWIGVSDKEEEGKFVSIDGNSLQYSNWFKGQPNDAYNDQDCAAMDKGAKFVDRPDMGKWNDRKCSVERPFMCEFRCF